MSEKEITAEEKYFNYYVETLTQTLNQQILTNVSASAKAKVNNEVLLEWQKQNESLKQQLAEVNSQNIALQEDLKKQIEQLKLMLEMKSTNNDNLLIQELVQSVNQLSGQINNLEKKNQEMMAKLNSEQTCFRRGSLPLISSIT